MKNNIIAIVFLLVLISCKQESTKNSKNSELDKIELENSNSIISAGNNVTKAHVYLNESDSLFYLKAVMQKDHRIFGYKKPDVQSKKLVLFSIFTNDIENNPFNLDLGAFYDLENASNLNIYYKNHDENYVEAIAIDETGKKTPVFFEKKWITIEEDDNANLDNELQEYGIIEKIEDGAYPFFIVTVNFIERKMKIDFNLNIEAISLHMVALEDLKGKYATILYTSEFENNLYDLKLNGFSLFGDYAPEFNARMDKFSGILNGADKITAGDLPSTISITNSENEKLSFELYIDDEIITANGKQVEAFYSKRVVNTITGLTPSND